MGNCFSLKKNKTLLTKSVDNKYISPIPDRLSTIIEERTIDINVSSDQIKF